MSNSSGDSVQIPLSAEQAEQQIDSLIAKLEETDDLLQKIRQDAQRAFQEATGVNVAPQNLGRVTSSYAPNQLSSAVSSEFAQAMQAQTQRQQTLEASLRTFVQSPHFKAGTPEQILSAFRAYAATPPPTSQALTPAAPSKPVPIMPSQEFGQQLARALEAYARPMLMSTTMM